MKFNKLQKNRLKRLILDQFHKTLEVYAEYFDQTSARKTIEAMGFRCLPISQKDTKNCLYVGIEAIDIIHHFGRPSRIDSLLNKYEYHWKSMWVRIPKDVAFHALTLGYLPHPDEWLNLIKEHLKISKRISEINQLIHTNPELLLRCNSATLWEEKEQLKEQQEKTGLEIERLVIKSSV